MNEGYDTWEAVRDALSVESLFETNGKPSGKRSAKKPKSTRPRRKQTKTSTPPSDANEDARNASEDDDDLFSLFSDSGNEDEPVVEEASSEEEEEEEKRGRRKKAGTGVRRPANRFNLYVIFNKMMRKQIAEENPDVDRHMLSRIVSERYRALTPVCRRQADMLSYND